MEPSWEIIEFISKIIWNRKQFTKSCLSILSYVNEIQAIVSVKPLWTVPLDISDPIIEGLKTGNSGNDKL